MSTTGRPYKRQLRNFLLDRKVQLRITVVMVLLSSALTAALGAFWYHEMRKASAVIQTNALATMGEDAAKELGKELAGQDLTRLLVLAGFALLLALVTAGYGIVMTHKIAGPLYKIKRHIDDITEGRLYELWPLRKGDQLQEFFKSFDAMNGALRERTESDMRLLSSLVAAIERGDDLSDRVEKLREVLREKGDSLREASATTMRIQRSELEAAGVTTKADS